MANQETIRSLKPTNIEGLMNILQLPKERAERTAELANKLKNDTISKVEFLEFVSNFFVRKEQFTNDKVTNFAAAPIFGLAHLGDNSPSINGLLRSQFKSVESKEDVIGVYEDAQEAGVIFQSSNYPYVLFHADDVSVDEDGSFEPNPQIVGEDNQEDEQEDAPAVTNAAEAAGLS